jgi:drug/metabolite transporter (DMT)-like permease
LAQECIYPIIVEAMKTKNVANVYLVLSLVLGSLVPIMLKIASQNINIYEYLFFTFLVALPVSFSFILIRKKTGRLISSVMNAKELAFIAFLGILNYGMLEYGLFYAEKYISVPLATVIYRTFPLVMLIFLPIMLRERISKYQLVALILAFAGLYLAVSGGSISLFSNANIPVIALVIAIAFSMAYASTAIKKYSFDMEIAIFIFNLAAFLFFAALFVAVKAPMQPINSSALMAILYVGIVYNVFVGLMYYGALRMIKTTFVTNIYFLSPFLTFLFSWLILGEQIYLYYIIIAVLVSIGLLIQKFDKKGGTYLSRNKKREETVFHDVTSAFINTNVPYIYDSIKSGGRVLAIKMDKDEYNQIDGNALSKFNNGKTMLYTDSNTSYINAQQKEFIGEIIGLNDDELAVMCTGNTEASEKALSEILDYKNIR